MGLKKMKQFKEVRENLEEATDLFDADGIKVTRFSLGKGRVGIQLSLSGKGTDNNFIKFDGEKLGKIQKALQVAQKRVKGR
tara:strand:+ start:555 stop:797 length:243 start_codon:yes stop_codon:yes gene_type:complete